MSFSLIILTLATFILLISLALLGNLKNYKNYNKSILLIISCISILVLCLRQGGGDSPYYISILHICRDAKEIAIRPDIFSIFACQLGKINIDFSILSTFLFLLPFFTILFVSQKIYGNSKDQIQQKYIFLLCLIGLALPGYFMSLIRFSIAVFFAYLILKKKSNFLIMFGAVSGHTTGFVYLISAIFIRNLSKIKYLIYRLFNELKIKTKYLYFNIPVFFILIITLIRFRESLIKTFTEFIIGHLYSISVDWSFNFSYQSILFIFALYFWTFLIRRHLNSSKLIFIFTSLIFIVNPYLGRFSIISFLFISEASAKYITFKKNALIRFVLTFFVLVPFLTFKSFYGYVSDKTPYSTLLGQSFSSKTFSNAYE